jgi:hypothetical protein
VAGEGKLAEQVRVGLMTDFVNEQSYKRVPEAPPSVLDERFHGRSVRSHVRSFGVLFSFISLGLAFYSSFAGWSLTVSGLLIIAAFTFYLLGVFLPLLLYPLWRAWMGLAKILNAIVTPLLLSALWIVLVIPLAYIMRIARVKAMDLSYRETCDSYWKTRKDAKQDFSLLERQW